MSHRSSDPRCLESKDFGSIRLDPMIGTLHRPYVAKHDSSWIQPLGKEGILGVVHGMGTIFFAGCFGVSNLEDCVSLCSV